MRAIGFLTKVVKGLRAVLGGLLLTVCALVFSSGTGAAEEQWKYLGSNQKGDRFFYDASSVTYLSADLIEVWTRELTGEGPTKRLREINCSSKIIRDREVIYEGKQKPRVLPKTPSDWRAMEQDPITKELYKVLCR